MGRSAGDECVRLQVRRTAVDECGDQVETMDDENRDGLYDAISSSIRLQKPRATQIVVG